jgi:hypothetical protein
VEPQVVDLGGGRKLSITSDALQFEAGPDTESVPLASIQRAGLVQRRVGFFAMTALLGALFAGFVSSNLAKGVIALVAALNLLMWFRLRQFALQLERKDGATTVLPLGQGGAEKSQVTQAAWGTVSNELVRRGIEIQQQ